MTSSYGSAERTMLSEKLGRMMSFFGVTAGRTAYRLAGTSTQRSLSKSCPHFTGSLGRVVGGRIRLDDSHLPGV